jgi:uncharacterized protein
MTQFAINYSPEAADLLQAERIEADYIKCPAWPEVIAAARGVRPLYVHFPLRIGIGYSTALDTETKQPADWARIAALLAQTGTPLLNVHLAPSLAECTGIPADSTTPADIARVTAGLVRDLQPVVARFGPERVIVENSMGGWGEAHPIALRPDVITRVLEETGCGLLLDVSHARLAVPLLGMDAEAYIAALPVSRTREIHITGIKPLQGRWLERMRENGVDADFMSHWGGQPIDHLPMTDEDWAFAAWAAGQVRSGAWGQPWVVANEYGGVGPVFAAFTDATALAEQTPGLYRLFSA